MDKKYELTNETKEYQGRVLHRIRALKDFGSVRAGDLGGWIEKEDNLSQFGACWVYGNVLVGGHMNIQKERDYLAVGPVGSRNDFTTFAKDQNGNVAVSCGCFYGTLDEFSEKVGATHGNNNFGVEYRAAIELAKAHFTEEEEQ